MLLRWHGYFYVKRVGTVQQKKEMDELTEHFYGFDARNIDDSKLIAHWLAGGGVTGWDDDQGVEGIEFSKDNANAIFLNPDLWDSANLILYAHGQLYANYLHDKISEDIEQAKKS